MINSTPCPLCAGGVGHRMDDAHAKRVRDLRDVLTLISELLNTKDGVLDYDLRQSIRGLIAKVEEIKNGQ